MEILIGVDSYNYVCGFVHIISRIYIHHSMSYILSFDVLQQFCVLLFDVLCPSFIYLIFCLKYFITFYLWKY